MAFVRSCRKRPIFGGPFHGATSLSLFCHSLSLFLLFFEEPFRQAKWAGETRFSHAMARKGRAKLNVTGGRRGARCCWSGSRSSRGTDKTHDSRRRCSASCRPASCGESPKKGLWDRFGHLSYSCHTSPDTIPTRFHSYHKAPTRWEPWWQHVGVHYSNHFDLRCYETMPHHPNCYCRCMYPLEALPPRAANSHSASVGKRNVMPVFSFSLVMDGGRTDRPGFQGDG